MLLLKGAMLSKISKNETGYFLQLIRTLSCDAARRASHLFAQKKCSSVESICLADLLEQTVSKVVWSN